MTDFRRRKMSNPVNPGQAFPVDALRRAKLLKQQRAFQKLDRLTPRKKSMEKYEAEVDRPMLVELHTLLGSLEDKEQRRMEFGEPIKEMNLYRQQAVPIFKNLMRKTVNGTYDSEKAVKLFMYLTTNLAKEYRGMSGMTSLANVGTRMALARQLRDEFEHNRSTGMFDEYIPKKYRRKELASERMLRMAGHSHRGMQQTEYCPKCKRYLTREDLP